MSMFNPQHLPLHVTFHMLCVLVVFMQALGDAAGGKQASSSTAKALEDSTPPQVGGSSKGGGRAWLSHDGPNWSGPVQFFAWALCQQCSPRMHLPNVKLYNVEQLHACCPIQPTAYAVTCYVVCVLVVFMQASGDAAGGNQGSSITNAVKDSTPQQVGGASRGMAVT
jgi:hypothetical protein